MLICLEPKTETLEVKKSRFIATACPCKSLDELKALIDQAWKAHPDASHVVHAAVIGTQFSCSDDHEPKNTAGRPALEVLKGRGLTDTAVLIVRYFGGTLLGTGGLVKAYGDSAKLALDGLKTEEKRSMSRFSFSVGYDLFELARRKLESLGARDLNTVFESEISIEGILDDEGCKAIQAYVQELTGGKKGVLISK